VYHAGKKRNGVCVCVCTRIVTRAYLLYFLYMAEPKGKGKEAAPSEGGGGGNTVFLVLFLLIVLWFMRGGNHAQLGSKMIQSPLATSTRYQWLPFAGGVPGTSIGQSGAVSGSGSAASNVPEAPTVSTNSSVSITEYFGARASDPQQEYFILTANPTNTAPVSISGWQVRSTRSGHTATIGGGTETALTGQAASPSIISLAPGQSAVISTGRSPVGISFRENKCTGYFAQFQTFAPSLAHRCPYPQAELSARSGLANDQQCVFAANTLAPCQAVTQLPGNISDACSMFLQQTFTYNGCVNAHRNDPDFGGGQWRVFLGQSAELWNNAGDEIAIIDMQGKTQASVTY